MYAGMYLLLLVVLQASAHKLASPQTQADIIGIPVDRPVMRETTSLGAVIAAGFAVGVWKGFDELQQINRADRTTFKPQLSKEASDRMYQRWEKAVEMSRGWLAADEDSRPDPTSPS